MREHERRARACRQHEQRDDRGGGGGKGSGRRGDGAHLRDPIEENEEVVVAATLKPRRASAQVMHACTPLEVPHAKPASLRGELRNLKLRQKATLDFATFQPPPRLSTAKLICTAAACHARAPETCRVSDARKGGRDPAGGREADGDCVANDPAGGDQGDGKRAKTRLEGSRVEEAREGSSAAGRGARARARRQVEEVEGEAAAGARRERGEEATSSSRMCTLRSPSTSSKGISADHEPTGAPSFELTCGEACSFELTSPPSLFGWKM